MPNSFQERKLYNKLMGTCMTITFDSYSIIVHNAHFMNEEHIEFIHSHNFHELYFILDGSLTMHCDGKNIELSKNSIFYISPNITHHVNTDSQYKNERFLIAFEIIQNQTSKQELTASEYQIQEISEILKQHAPYWTGEDANNVSVLLDYICDEVIRSMPLYHIKLQNLISSIIISLLQNMTEKESDSIDKHLEFCNRAILMTRYIHDNFKQRITLEMVANHFHTTPRHVNRLFKQYFNTSFSKSLTIIRLGYAKKYLRYGYSIEKIAELTGFASVRTLYKDFKEYEGMSMSDYRNTNSNIEGYIKT
ncbi:AraC family transcriptional regulator [Alkalibaculum sp. M08DMB]|uniref:AraC family transcriptional regulator n=1 Tax=Alkalibaculum sporogenes TaxID=2655001 RepID=A0A6A7K4Z1_9FIRM|nr:AraC family transcriptional regulator [Alkalibaculum sporogenes]MPW24458.1 AraC family transcriptional regulator [Alkalibaculum sporogenes]